MKNEMSKIFLFLLLLIPLVSAFNITNSTLKSDTLGYSIYVNNSINLSRILINPEIKVYNLSTTANFTNNGLSNSILSFYNLNNYPFNDGKLSNGTIYYNISDLNITIPTGNYLEIRDFSAPIIRIPHPLSTLDVNSDPVNFIIYTSENASCDVAFDTDLTRKRMNSSNGLNFTYDQSIDNGENHIVYFYCNDTYANEGTNSTYYDVYVNLGKINSGSSGGGGGGADLIELDNLTLDYSDWQKGKENTIYAYTKDKKGNLIDVQNVTFTIIDNITYDFEKTRLNKGVYEGKFKVIGDEKEVLVKVIATQYGKSIVKEAKIQIKELTIIQKTEQMLENKSMKFKALISSKVIRIIFLLFLFVLTAITIYLIIYRKRKQ